MNITDLLDIFDYPSEEYKETLILEVVCELPAEDVHEIIDALNEAKATHTNRIDEINELIFEFKRTLTRRDS